MLNSLITNSHLGLEPYPYDLNYFLKALSPNTVTLMGGGQGQGDTIQPIARTQGYIRYVWSSNEKHLVQLRNRI